MKIFCMTNCWTNYDIVASAIVEKWIKKGLETNGIKDYEIKSFYRDTPYLAYYAVGSETLSFSAAFQCYAKTDNVAGSGVSQQFAVYIWIIAIAAVILAHIQWADLVFIENNSVITLSMISAIETLATSLGKQIVYWRDDAREQWGTTNDPLTIGMLPSAYKYIWMAAENQAQDPKFSIQQDNNNPKGIFAVQGSNNNICSHFMSTGNVLSNKWTTIASAIALSRLNTHSQTNTTFPGTRMQALADIGKNIINFTEVVKPANPYYKKAFGTGWIPAPPPENNPSIGNTTLYNDCLNVILASVAPNLLDSATVAATGVKTIVTGFPDDEVEFITSNYKMSALANGGNAKCPTGYTTSYFPGDPNCPSGWCGCSKVPKSSNLSQGILGGETSYQPNTGQYFSRGARINPASSGMPLLFGALGKQISSGEQHGLQAERQSVFSGPTRFPAYPQMQK